MPSVPEHGREGLNSAEAWLKVRVGRDLDFRKWGLDFNDCLVFVSQANDPFGSKWGSYSIMTYSECLPLDIMSDNWAKYEIGVAVSLWVFHNWVNNRSKYQGLKKL